jgi:hypothetical protein
MMSQKSHWSNVPDLNHSPVHESNWAKPSIGAGANRIWTVFQLHVFSNASVIAPPSQVLLEMCGMGKMRLLNAVTDSVADGKKSAKNLNESFIPLQFVDEDKGSKQGVYLKNKIQSISAEF